MISKQTDEAEALVRGTEPQGAGRKSSTRRVGAEVCTATSGRTKSEERPPQGGPLSPLLSNILLTDLDRELERRGLVFCRYADDCNIYVRSRVAGERVMRGVRAFLEEVS
jgi:hypothetical protein